MPPQKHTARYVVNLLHSCPVLINMQNLYCISELAQEIIKVRAKLNGWQLTSYPGKVKLPGDIFKSLASAEVANRVGFACPWEGIISADALWWTRS
jgi:Sister chromatid cohesion protein PDS5 protein